MGFVFAFRQGCREGGFGGRPGLRADEVQGKIKVHPCTVACASFHFLDVDLDISGSDEDEVSVFQERVARTCWKCRCNF